MTNHQVSFHHCWPLIAERGTAEAGSITVTRPDSNGDLVERVFSWPEDRSSGLIVAHTRDIARARALLWGRTTDEPRTRDREWQVQSR